MADAATNDKKSQSWRPLLWGLAVFLLLPWVPLGDVIFPIQQTLLLFVAALAVCALMGWKSGSRAALAVIWLALAVWMLLQPAGPPGTAYNQMARGWAILLAASFGVAAYPDDATDPIHLVELADSALYRAKRGGRNRICAYRPSLALTESPLPPRRGS